MVAIAMMVLFLHACTWDHMIFSAIKEFIHPDKWISKPLYGCPICMTPWWGTIIYLLFIHVSFADWAMTVFAAAGINVISVVFLTIRDYLTQD